MLTCANALHSEEDARSKALGVLRSTTIGAECERASLLVVDAVSEQLFLIAQDAAFGMRLPLHAGVAGRCATTGDVILVSDAYTHTSFERSVDRETGFVTRSILAVPIRIGWRIVGVLEALNHTGEGFHSAHVELMNAVAVQVPSCPSAPRVCCAALRIARRLVQPVPKERPLHMRPRPPRTLSARLQC